MRLKLIKSAYAIASTPRGNGQLGSQSRTYEIQILTELQSGIEIGKSGEEGGCPNSEGN